MPLNRQAHHTKFQYLTSDYSSLERQHQRREVPFSLLEERDDAARDENVLRATANAINALIGGLNFDVEDEQVATELVLERQLERNAFDSAVASAERARLLSLSLSVPAARVDHPPGPAPAGSPANTGTESGARHRSGRAVHHRHVGAGRSTAAAPLPASQRPMAAKRQDRPSRQGRGRA
ncbi:MAG: hypothetical protein ACRDNW_09660 [Trebonia sp.]